MNTTVLKKLLLSKNRPAQLVLAMLGAFLGLLIVTGGFQTYRTIATLLNEKDLLGGDYIVINKKVGLLNTLSGSSPSFGPDEIRQIGKIPGIDKVGAFESGNFKASMELSGSIAAMAGQAFKSDMFFEALPDAFVDINPEDWKWNPNVGEVPVIVSSEYIKLYNAAFARSQNLPVIPESMLKSITFNIRIAGNGQTELVAGRIAGFSQRINSILVPKSFLDYANAKYSNGDSKEPARLILHSKDPASPALASALRKTGYELNEEKLKSSELNGILQMLITAVSVVGLLIVFLALLGFIQYNQLMAYRSAYEIQTLHWLGYPTTKISKPYIAFTFKSVGITFVLATGSMLVLQLFLSSWLRSQGFEQELPSILPAIGAGFGISLFMAVTSAWAAAKQVKQLAK